MEDKQLYDEIIDDLLSELDLVKLKEDVKTYDRVSYRLCDCHAYNRKRNYSKEKNFNLVVFKKLLEDELHKNKYFILEMEVFKSKNRYNEVYINIEFIIVK